MKKYFLVISIETIKYDYGNFFINIIKQLHMKKIIVKAGNFLLLGAACLACVCCSPGKNIKSPYGIPNPWIECGKDLDCAAQKAGFAFPLRLSEYSVRAMNNMIEVTYFLDGNREVVVRKCGSEINGGDISGDYGRYPICEEILLHDCVPITLKKDNDRIYVMYFGAESGYFSARCEKGMNLKDVEDIYETIAQAEAPGYE